VKQIRKHITFANVMSSIAVFLVLGGASAYAAKKIGSNEIKGNSITTGKIKKEAISASKIKKNAVTTAKIANGAVTGAKLNLGTVGTVPNAAHAINADNANNANTVGGNTVRRFSYITDNEGNSPQNVLSLGGITLTANCEGGLLTAFATTSVANSMVHSGGTNLGNEPFYNEFDSWDPGEKFEFLSENENDSNQGTLTYANTSGGVVTVTFASEEGGMGGKECILVGSAIG
jgi:hypothetical protein